MRRLSCLGKPRVRNTPTDRVPLRRVGRSPWTAAGPPAGLCGAFFVKRRRPARRGLPTLCQEELSSEEGAFLSHGDSTPNPWDLALSSRHSSLKLEHGVAGNVTPCVPHSLQRSGRIPTSPYPLCSVSKHSSPHRCSFISPPGPRAALPRLAGSYSVPDRSMDINISRLRSASPRKARPWLVLTCAQFPIVPLGSAVFLHAGSRPVIERIA